MMQSKFVLSLLSLLILTAMVLGTGSVQAEETAPPPEDYRPEMYDYLQQDHYGDEGFDNLLTNQDVHSGNWDQGNQHLDASDERSLRTSGGPDEFGYTWAELADYEWVDFTSGIPTGIDNIATSAFSIDIGFDFKYYENEYFQLNIFRHGYITFGDNYTNRNQSSIPDVSAPNNVIAPHWVPSDLINYVKYLRGGDYPNRWFAVEWNELASRVVSDWNMYTFQMILFEDGNIQFNYGDMLTSNSWFCQSSGIEDQDGMDGLTITQFCEQIYPDHAVLISRPVDQRRLSLSPARQGMFLSAGQAEDFILKLRNSGDLGEDSYVIGALSNWSLSLFYEDGVTPLTSPLTLNQGESIDLIARVTAPMNVQVGDFNTASVTATSSDTSKSRTVSLTSTVPAPFAMIMQDYGDGMGIGSYLVTPTTQNRAQLNGWGNDLAVVELPNRNQLYAWTEWRCLEWDDSHCLKSVGEIKYAIQDRFGNEVLPPTILADLSSAPNEPRDLTPALAVAPNGNIGVIWNRIRSRQESGVWKYNYNIHFAVLDQNGGVVANPLEITSDQNFRNWQEVGYVYRYDPRITATEDGRFSFVWTAYRKTASGYVRNVLFGIRGNQGGLVFNPVLLTDSVENTRIFESPTITAVSGNKVFITWRRVDITHDGQYQYWDYSLSSSVRDSSGAIVKAVINIPNTRVWNPVAALLSDGNIILAGSEYNYITYLLFDGNTFNPLNGQVFLPDPDGFYGQKFLTITGDPDGRVVLTWMYDPYAWQGRPSTNLFYALLENDGSVVTPAMPFYAAVQSEWGGQPHVRTGRSGQGHTTYMYSFPPFITSEPPTEVIEGELYSYSITVDDVDLPDETLTISALVKPDWLTLTDNGDSTGTLSGTPTSSDAGEHGITLLVTDQYSLTGTQEFTVTVLLKEAPLITSNDRAVFAVGLEGTFTITATGVPTPVLNLTGDLPTGVSFTVNEDGTATLAGIPEAGTGGDYALVITASNGMLPNAEQSFTLIVGQAPTITSDDSEEFTVGVTGEFPVTTSGFPAPDIEMAGTLPGGVTFTDIGDGTAKLSGTPVTGSGGVYVVVLTADNGSGYIADQTFILVVKTEAEIGSGGGDFVSNDGAVKITIYSGTVPDGTKFIFTPQLEPTEPVPGSLSFANLSFQLTTIPSGLSMPFDPPLTVRIEYDPALLEDMPEDSLMLYYWTGSEWQDAAYEGVYRRSDTSFGEYWFEVEIDHLTEFAVMGSGGSEVFLPLILR